jgi:RNA polymerase sigma factor (sigma-70 family)
MGEAELIEDRRAPRLGCDTPRRYLDERALFACDDARNPAFSFAGRAMERSKTQSADSGTGGEDARSLEHLARRYSRALASFFQRRVTNKADVPDLVQDTFLRLAKLPSLDELRQPEHYLFQTASSALRDRARRDTVREHGAHQEFDETYHGGTDISPERVAIGRFAVRELREVIARLPERTRDIFVLRVFEEMRTAEIASALGISQRAVEKHHAKALAKVTAAMKARGHV